MSIILRNAQAADLLCMAPEGKAFAVEVKGKESRLLGCPPARTDLYYVFVSVAANREGDRFYVMPSAEVARLLSEHVVAHPNDTKASGFRFNALADFVGAGTCCQASSPGARPAARRFRTKAVSSERGSDK